MSTAANAAEVNYSRTDFINNGLFINMHFTAIPTVDVAAVSHKQSILGKTTVNRNYSWIYQLKVYLYYPP